jgi:hypothetical protein
MRIIRLEERKHLTRKRDMFLMIQTDEGSPETSRLPRA